MTWKVSAPQLTRMPSDTVHLQPSHLYYASVDLTAIAESLKVAQ